MHLGSAQLRPDQGRRTESARLKTSGSSAAARVPDQAALCAGAMHARVVRACDPSCSCCMCLLRVPLLCVPGAVRALAVRSRAARLRAGRVVCLCSVRLDRATRDMSHRAALVDVADTKPLVDPGDLTCPSGDRTHALTHSQSHRIALACPHVLLYLLVSSQNINYVLLVSGWQFSIFRNVSSRSYCSKRCDSSVLFAECMSQTASASWKFCLRHSRCNHQCTGFRLFDRALPASVPASLHVCVCVCVCVSVYVV